MEKTGFFDWSSVQASASAERGGGRERKAGYGYGAEVWTLPKF